MHTILLITHIVVAVALVGLVLIQHGKGADMGAAFGSGASGTVFGARGSASFLTRATAVLAMLFFVISLVLAYLAAHTREEKSVADQAPAAQVQPAIPQSEQGAGAASDVPVLPEQPLVPDVPK